jgi:phosphatidylinositol alpha-1,6-mannosyltransferase
MSTIAPDLFPNAAPVVADFARPVLCTIVDAEEEFAWDQPFRPENNGTASIRAQARLHQLYAHYGVRPTYLITYPLASDPTAIAILRDYLAAGACDIGAQLHPWVTPPFGQVPQGTRAESLSYPGNLPVALERDKFRHLVDAIEAAFAIRPTAYKAGRYGFGPNTSDIIEEAGFLVDTSLIPRTSYASAGGPDFWQADYRPFWFGQTRRMLELPVTRALTGLLARRSPWLYEAADRQPLRALHAPGLLARARMVERITLSPEGSDLGAMCRLARSLLAGGTRILTLSYHSPSMEPGNTPYVRTERDLSVFIDRISGFLSFFRDEVGGEFLSIERLHQRLSGALVAPPAQAPRPPEIRISPPNPAAPRDRCLVVANTFPPVHGGSAVVYDSLGRFGQGRVSVLAPREDYRSGLILNGWREFDAAAPFPIHRLRLLRTRLASEAPGLFGRLKLMAQDVAIRARLVLAIGALARRERIGVVCVGELVANGWLTTLCHWLGLRSIIYIHGEEISTNGPYDVNRFRRRRALAQADAVVAVSRFTRTALGAMMGVGEERVTLISNGVDLSRFTPRPPRPDLVARYGLAGARVLLTVGRLHERKGMDRVIESLPAVRAAVPGLRYLLVGDGPYRGALERLAAERGVSDAVVFAGAVADGELVDHYALAEAFVMANREMPDGDNEGFGLVFLEANACGIPVIAGAAGGSGDAVTADVNGLVVDGRDTAAVTQAILRMFGDAELRARLVRGGREVAAQSGWDGRIGQFVALCDRLVTPVARK